MTVRPLHVLGSPVLRQRADEVGTVTAEVRALVKDLFDTMYAFKGIGLAANQVGLAHRVAVVETGDGRPIVLIDPEIVDAQGTERGEEGCLSIPDLFGEVDRAIKIGFETTTLEGKRQRLEASDLTARAVQHEIDHLNGTLFLDRLGPLKRRMLLKKWRKMRKGELGHTIEAPPTTADR